MTRLLWAALAVVALCGCTSMPAVPTVSQSVPAPRPPSVVRPSPTPSGSRTPVASAAPGDATNCALLPPDDVAAVLGSAATPAPELAALARRGRSPLLSVVWHTCHYRTDLGSVSYVLYRLRDPAADTVRREAALNSHFPADLGDAGFGTQTTSDDVHVTRVDVASGRLLLRVTVGTAEPTSARTQVLALADRILVRL